MVNKLVSSCFGICWLFSLFVSSEAAVSEFRIYGPGWDTPELIFPSRYFFVRQFTEKTVSKVEVVERELYKYGRGCRIWAQVFNETNFEDRMLIIRYKLMSDSCANGILIRLLDEQSNIIAEKETKAPVYAEECSCPKDDWYELMKCDSHKAMYNRIYQDLRPFNNSNFNFEISLNEMKRRFAPHTRSFSFCHYVIINNKLHRKCYGEYVGFAQFMDEMLISLIKKVRFADTQFIVNLGDWPLSDGRDGIIMPVFSWCGSDDTFDIVLPTYESTESLLNMQGRISLDVLSAFGKQNTPRFEEKKSKLFWRGRDSNRLRLNLIEMSKKYPKLIDAALTNFFFFRDEIEKYGPKVAHSNFYEFFEYKYQINVDGTVAAYRLPNMLAGTSLVLKPKSKFYEHFYHLLKPGVHFVDVDQKLDDLLPILRRLIGGKGYSGDKYIPSNVEEQKKIIKNARNFVLNELLPSNIYCYYFKALTEYSLLLKEEVALSEGMELIYEASKSNCKCETVFKDEL